MSRRKKAVMVHTAEDLDQSCLASNLNILLPNVTQAGFPTPLCLSILGL